LAHPLLCTIFTVPRTTIYEVRGDFREPETNPDYYFIGSSRSLRLERVAESFMLRKLFGAWSGGVFQSRADVADGVGVHSSAPQCKSMQACVEEKEEEIVPIKQDEEDEMRMMSPWPVRSGFRFSAFSECLLRGPIVVEIAWKEGDLTDA